MLPQLETAMELSSKEPEQIELLQYGRGLAALLVCFFHTNILVEIRFSPFPGGQIFAAGHSGVEFFFVLSGFIIFHAHKKDLGRPLTLPTFCLKRAIRLLPMFWLIVIPLGVMYLLVPNSGEHSMLTLPELARDLLLIPRNGILTLEPAWTLQHEVIFYAVFSLLLLNARLGGVAFGIWQLLCLAYLAVGPSDQDYRQPISKFLGYYNFGFAFGVAIAVFYDSGVFARLRPYLPQLAVTAAAALAVMFIGEARTDGLFPSYIPLRTILYFCIYSVLVLGALSIKWKRRPMLDRVLGPLGAASYVLYLSHEAVSSLTVRLIGRLGPSFATSPVAIFGIIVAACVAAAIAMHYTVERPSLAFLRRRLLEGRREMIDVQSNDRSPRVLPSK